MRRKESTRDLNCCILDNQVLVDHLRYHLLDVKLSLSMITTARTSVAICHYAAEKLHEQVKSNIK